MWSHNPTLNNATINDLSSGTYIVSVTDANNCQSETSIDINPQGSISVTIDILNQLDCYGDSNAEILASSPNALGGITYYWPALSLSGSTLENLNSGTFVVEASDSYGCTGSSSVNIYEPYPIQLDFNITNVSCKDYTDGSISALPSGGSSPYTFIWSNGIEDNSCENLQAGIITVTVTDFSGCSVSESATINQPTQYLNLSIIANDILCHNQTNGEIQASASGGTEPYSYNWNNGMSGEHINSLTGGYYTLTLTDNYGCEIDTIVLIQQPAALVVEYETGNPSCYGHNDGYINLAQCHPFLYPQLNPIYHQ